MLAVESWVVEDGLRVDVRSVCNSRCMRVERCQGKRVSFTVPTEEFEFEGFRGALRVGVARALEEFPELLELIDH